MRPYEHADDRTSEQRFQRIAALLAAGLRRLGPRIASPADSGQHATPKIHQNYLRMALSLAAK